MFNNKEEFKIQFIDKMKSMISKPIEDVTDNDAYNVLCSLIMETVNKNWAKTNKYYRQDGVRQVYYFSIEFLIGKLLISNLINLDLINICRQGLAELGFDLEKLENKEPEAGLGNGGLGRLAAAFLDSLASLELPGHGCGIRYKYGLFNQKIVEGHQVELPDYWLSNGYPWEFRRADRSVEVHFGGEVDVVVKDGRLEFVHKNYESVIAVPYDIPIVGYKNKTVNTLRLWNAEVANVVPEQYNNKYGGRSKLLDYKRSVESIAEFLYPDDSDYEGKLLRLKQQYFLCSAGLQSIFQTYAKQNLPFQQISEKVRLHINDTHPALLIPEMMRILIDEKGLGWDEAWAITTRTVSYTNHTIMSEALEKWPVDMFKNLLPRIYMIIGEINERFCKELWDLYPGNFDRIAEMAIIADDQIRMANLAIVGGRSVNGVSPLHTKILKEKQMNQFYRIFPYKFNNKTNGITHRRWLLKANPQLTSLITDVIGDKWLYQPSDIIGILNSKDDPVFKERIKKIKLANKEKLVELIKAKTGIIVGTNTIFDVHAKRLHGYKRQLMNIFHIIHLYNYLKANPQATIYPRTFIFAAKAAPSYYFAKQVIKLINSVAEVINKDDSINDLIKVVFLENYSVSLAETIIPAADISEQISTASMEASGTGNIKFMMNGALTIGTMDGANIEIYDMVGDDNIFIFGLTAEEVLDYYRDGGYSAHKIYHSDNRIKEVLNQLLEPGRLLADVDDFKSIYNDLLNSNDPYFVLKDFDNYAEIHQLIEKEYLKQDSWLEKSIINIAHSGKLSSDKSISEYASEIWRIRRKPIDLNLTAKVTV